MGTSYPIHNLQPYCCTACHQNLQASIQPDFITPRSLRIRLCLQRHSLQQHYIDTDFQYGAIQYASVISSSQLATAQCKQITLRYITSDTQNTSDLDHNNDQSNNCSSNSCLQQLATPAARFHYSSHSAHSSNQLLQLCTSTFSSVHQNPKTAPTN